MLHAILQSSQVIDWSHLTQLAERHSVMPLVYENISRYCADRVPAKILLPLKQQFRANGIRNLMRTRELLTLLNELRQQGILALPFKGPEMAVSAYGDLARRQFSDLDILVPEVDLVRARDWFMTMGDRMKIERATLTDSQYELFVRSPQIHRFIRECAYPFVRQSSQTVVELHWRVMPKHFAFSIDSPALWQNLETVSILGEEVTKLSTENSLLLLCGHGSKDCWDKLARVCDIAALIHTHPELDWPFLMNRAKQLGGQRLVLLGLLLAQMLLGTSLPPMIQEAIAADTVLPALAEETATALFANHASQQPFRATQFHLKIRERWLDKARYFSRIAMTPTTLDWQMYPRSTFPPLLYYLLRPVRLILQARGKQLVRE
ncbi:nucleotidyltransferase family protein [Oscillatoria sp. FACHB-1407]|uniref:nucleotidyltransferase domain-containing protein n=1 Tax=Oscillatoria sp. FACHB-1407 TaxID=2692847 RepID=UPI0016894D9C|nr:nucleotidyltransferase family protein [Oscillatoria sp. FACHB-1407]MBD2459425.1 nucleotidyltransferase family protein [Oscillatoria sp. FACHB-1407]